MKIYKTSNWRDIVEIEAIKKDKNNVWLAPTDLNSSYPFKNSIRKLERNNGIVIYWDTFEEAKNYLTKKLNSEILRYEKQILKAKAKIELLNK